MITIFESEESEHETPLDDPDPADGWWSHTDGEDEKVEGADPLHELSQTEEDVQAGERRAETEGARNVASSNPIKCKANHGGVVMDCVN
jgi:hypothetical protein